MKLLLHIATLSLVMLLFSCNEDQPAHSSDSTDGTQQHAHLKDKSENIAPNEIAFNSTDRSGKKQGKWMTKHRNGLPGYEYWRNDTLHGYFKFWYQDSTKLFEEGWHSKGRLDSFLFIYERGKLKGVSKFEDGSWQWIGFPSDAQYILPEKSFGMKAGSVYVDCPYANKKTWYRGLFVNRKPSGIHYSYREDGSLRYKYDYDSKQVLYYDKNGQLIDTMSMERCGGVPAGK